MKRTQISFDAHSRIPSISYIIILILIFLFGMFNCLAFKSNAISETTTKIFNVQNQTREASVITTEGITFWNFFVKIILKLPEQTMVRLTSSIHFHTSKRVVHSNVFQTVIYPANNHDIVLFH